MPLRKLKLDSLLDITKAISKNTQEDDLYKIFYYTLISNPQLNKIAMLVEEEGEWYCKFSNSDSLSKGLVLSTFELDLSKVDGISEAKQVFPTIGQSLDFDFIIPVAHKEKTLALVLISDDQLSKVVEDHDYPIMSFVQTVANIIMTAIENKRMGREKLKQEALRKEMEIAREVQRMLLPKKLTQSDEYELHVNYIPNRTVGGDYYDYISLGENEFLLCIADVSGKGVPASIIMSNFQAGLRLLCKSGKSLDVILNDLNNMIYLNASAEKFITTFLAKCNTFDKTIEYVNAGHNPVHLLSDSEVMELTEGSTIIGAVDPLPYIKVSKLKYKTGDVLLMYTDGLLEAKNEEEEDFGTERAAQILLKNKKSDLSDLADDILNNLNKYVGSDQYEDDLTILSCRFH